MSDLRQRTESLAALTLAKFWIETLVKEMDIDPESTTVTVNAVGPNGKRELAKRNLAQSQQQISRAIESLADLDGTSGQDRDSYSDDQDRDSYTVED